MATEPTFLSPEYFVNWLIYSIQESELEGHTLNLKGSENAKGKNHSAITLDDKDDSENKLIDGLRGICQRLHFYRNEFYRLVEDSSPWSLGSEAPDGPLSACHRRIVQVDSGALRFIGGPHMGWHDYRTNKWTVLIGNIPVEHEVERWRCFPDAPGEAPEYEKVKTEVERLRSFLKPCKV